jgi:hypothetical protein
MDATGRSNTCCTGCWIICWETAGKRAKAQDRGIGGTANAHGGSEQPEKN